MMKTLQKIALVVGCLSLAFVASSARSTGREVALAAVDRYNNLTAPTSPFKLLQVTVVKTQTKSHRTMYEVNFLTMETFCNPDGVVMDVSDCPFKENGVKMKCVTRAVQSRSPTQLRFHGVECHQVPEQVDLPVLARQEG
ncbi:cathelicidin-2-like [Leucoraja erinacea]|uniref:cathelicidin-2-like n=1 Tax=Leucoraja erinaceus TaxID=7782 RepID=UPI002455DA56|nr:cathelicidin-2-like [Leucoraja erinacea]